MNNKKKLTALIVLYILASLTLRLIYLHQFSLSPLFETPRGPDVEEYCAWAKEIVAGRILWPYVKIHAPLYPFFLAFLCSFFANFQNSFYYIRLSQIMLGFAAFIPLCATILLIKKEQKDADDKKYRNMIIAFLILWGWYPPMIYYLGELTSEILLIPLLSSAVFLFYKAEASLFESRNLNKGELGETPQNTADKTNMESSSSVKHPSTTKNATSSPDLIKKKKDKLPHPPTKNIFLVIAGVCSGLAVIAHPLALFFMFFEVIYLFLRRNFKGLACFGLCALMMIAPISLYNIVVLREPIPIQANGGFNLYLGNNEDSDGTCSLRPGPEWDAFHLGADYKSQELGISKDSLLIQKTVKFIFNNPLYWLKLLAQKSVFVWSQREITAGADLYPLRYFTPFQRFFSWSFGVCAVLALMAVFMNWKNNWSFYARYRHVLILISAFWISQTLLVTSGRYRISMLPCILILSAWTLTHYVGFIKQRSGNNIRLLLCIIAAIAIVYIPQPPFKEKRENGEANTLLGEAYLLEGENNKAEKHLQASIKQLPPWSRSYNLLGLIKEKQEDHKEAMIYYLKAVQTDSSDPDAFMNIALLFSRKKEPEKAADFFKKAFTLKNPSAELFYNYALFCFNNDGKKEARENYLTCLKINPAHEKALNNLGIIAFTEGQYPEAVTYFEKALLLDPCNTLRMVNLAAAKFAAGEKDQAENIIDKVLRKNPHLITAQQLKSRIRKANRK